jgi:hypothetical protein
MKITLNLHDTEVERSPNLELYTCACNTINLHDTEVKRSPNLKLYTFVCNTINLHDRRLSVLHTNV